MVTKGEALKVIRWLKEAVLDEYTMDTSLQLAALDPLTVTGRQAAITGARIQGAAELLQYAETMLEKVAEEE